MAAPARAALVGRAAELDRVDRFLAREAGESDALVVEGAAGIGKTVVWDAGVDRARARGFRVLRARPAELERALPYAALGDLLADVHDEIGSLPGPQRRALRVALLLDEPHRVPVDPRAIAVGLSGLLETLAEDGKPLVAVDDAQWLDDASSSAIRFALRRVSTPALLTCRPPAGGALVDGAAVLPVSPLGLADLGELIRLHLDASFRRPILLEIERVSGGNPFYALELARALAALPLEGPSPDPLPVPTSLLELVSDRLDRLTPQGRAAALVAAAALRPTQSVLDEAVGSDLDELYEADVLTRDGERVRFTHPLLAATVYSTADPRQPAAAHGVLVAFAADPEERGYHVAAAADGPDRDAAAAISRLQLMRVHAARRPPPRSLPRARSSSHRRTTRRSCIAAGCPRPTRGSPWASRSAPGPSSSAHSKSRGAASAAKSSARSRSCC